MDSLSQIVLGGAVAAAIAPPRHRRAALLAGGALGTLPDLDGFVIALFTDDPVQLMTLHRGASHSLLVLPWVGWFIWRLFRRRGGRVAEAPHAWLWAIMVVLITHPLLDAFTAYGTQLLWPLPLPPIWWSTVFIIDPLYTLPLLVGLALALGTRAARLRWNTAGLVVSTLYVGWSLLAQQQVVSTVHATLAARDGATVPAARILVTPTAFNTVLWRVVLMHEDRYEEGFRSLLDSSPTMRFHSYPNGHELYPPVRSLPAVQRMAQFTHGFFRLAERDDRIELTDLRMGQEPWYSFSFVVARRDDNPGLHPLGPISVGGREGMDLGAMLRWLRIRALGTDIDPPR